MDKRDTIVGALPFFHSFGFTGTIWFPLMGGFPVVYHRSPLEAAAIQKVIREHRATVTMSTPTFLQMWMKKFRKEDVATLRFVVAGAEKLREQVARDFVDKYGIPILEGYGATELSPVACINVMDVKEKHTSQLGSKPGKVGRPLPGVSVKVVDPETGVLRNAGEAGMLLVKGPNVMNGYWNNPEQTANVMRDGWYVTGDIAAIDEDGFVQITDRLSRFSKIGGEMVPHMLIEERLFELSAEPESRFLVTSISDEKKGESLVVLYFNYQGSVSDLVEKMKNTEVPKLWIPEIRRFYTLKEWPTLGTGKVDMAKARKLARELSAS